MSIMMEGRRPCPWQAAMTIRRLDFHPIRKMTRTTFTCSTSQMTTKMTYIIDKPFKTRLEAKESTLRTSLARWLIMKMARKVV